MIRIDQALLPDPHERLQIRLIELQQRGAKFQKKFRRIENRPVSHNHLHPTYAMSA